MAGGKFAVAQGIVGGLEKLTSRMVDLSVARENMKMKKESHALDIKEQKIRMQRFQLDPNNDPEILTLRSENEEKQLKAEGANLDFEESTIANQQKLTQKELENSQLEADAFAKGIEFEEQEQANKLRLQELKIQEFIIDGGKRKKSRNIPEGEIRRGEKLKGQLETQLEKKRLRGDFELRGAKRTRTENRLKRLNARLGIVEQEAQVKQDVAPNVETNQERERAIAALETAGAKITEANIKSAIAQLKGE